MTAPRPALRRLARGRRIPRCLPHLAGYCDGLVGSFHGDADRARKYVTLMQATGPRRDWWKDVGRMLDRMYPHRKER